MNGLLFALQQKLGGTSAAEPYCVLSRDLVLRVIGALNAEPAPSGDGWLTKVEQATTTTEFRLYRALYQAEGRTLTNDMLMKAIGRRMSAEALWVHKRRLQVKMAKHGWGEIKTVRGTGYYLELPAMGNFD